MTITAKKLAHSICNNGEEIVTFELEYPRIVHSEFMTHRVFSRNAASSRAIPIEKMNSLIMDNPAMPSKWGKNQPGMQAGSDHDGLVEVDEGVFVSVEEAWKIAMKNAVDMSSAISDAGYHKQIANRLTEPFSHMKTIMTTTDIFNFFNLRIHEEADPTIKELAGVVCDSYYHGGDPLYIEDGEWHLPYIRTTYDESLNPIYRVRTLDEAKIMTLEEARMTSVAACAQVSYRNLNYDMELVTKIFNKLCGMPPHLSPFEHVATPIFSGFNQMGVTHMFKDGVYGSGNLRGWAQFRNMPELF